jgi:hypothetical protein
MLAICATVPMQGPDDGKVHPSYSSTIRRNPSAFRMRGPGGRRSRRTSETYCFRTPIRHASAVCPPGSSAMERRSASTCCLVRRFDFMGAKRKVPLAACQGVILGRGKKAHPTGSGKGGTLRRPGRHRLGVGLDRRAQLDVKAHGAPPGDRVRACSWRRQWRPQPR